MFHPTKLPMDGIAPVHVRRILAGFCSLSLSWSQVRQNMIVLPRHAVCSEDYHNTICIPATSSQWINAVIQAETISIAEMGYRINALKDYLSIQLSSRNTYDSERCQHGPEVLISLAKWYDELTGTMEDHFFVTDPPFEVIYDAEAGNLRKLLPGWETAENVNLTGILALYGS
ncbi:hypothetical protein B0H13DRAFT_2310243 [Mycena leptocephala]|nr:hypothetical protein B0H13DRAFT_2310243 [Mycena leptocephala]